MADKGTNVEDWRTGPDDYRSNPNEAPSTPIDVIARKPQKSLSSSNYFSINNFRSEITYNETVATHSYLVQFSPFKAGSNTAGPLSSFISANRDAIVLRCDQAVIPALNIMTDGNVRRFGYGPVEHMPHGAIFNDITLSWIVDGYGLLPQFFHDWHGSIVNTHSKGGQDMETNTTRGNLAFSPYEIGYKDDYTNPCMSIFIYDRQLNTVMEYKCYDVFPKSIMDTPLHWGETDTVMRMQVLFSCTDYEIVTSNPTIFDRLGRSLSLGMGNLGRDLVGSIL